MSAVIEQNSYKIVGVEDNITLEAPVIYKDIVVSIHEVNEKLVGLAVNPDSLPLFINEFLKHCKNSNPYLFVGFFGGAKPVATKGHRLPFYRSKEKFAGYLAQEPSYQHYLNYLASLKELATSKEETSQLKLGSKIYGNGFTICIDRTDICCLVVPTSVSMSPTQPVLKTQYHFPKRKSDVLSSKESESISPKSLKSTLLGSGSDSSNLLLRPKASELFPHIASKESKHLVTREDSTDIGTDKGLRSTDRSTLDLEIETLETSPTLTVSSSKIAS